MSRALVVHPHLDLWAGGEYIALLVCKSLLENGYNVSVACENFDVRGAERIWGMGGVMNHCQWIPLPRTIPRLSCGQRAMFLPIVKRTLAQLDPDLVFNTQFSAYMMNGPSLAYHHGDLQYLYGNTATARGFYYSTVRRMMNYA